MKIKFRLVTLLLCSFSSLPAKTFTITNSGLTFTPNTITIGPTDTVDFSISTMHSALEVDNSTYNANGNTPLGGGFSVPFGGGKVSNLSMGTHYFVCAMHYSNGMKGHIIVANAAGIMTSSIPYYLQSPSQIKITDLSGRLISNFGTVNTNGSDFGILLNNQPGFYLLKATNKNGLTSFSVIKK